MAMLGSTLFQCLLGIRCQDFAMVAADQMNTQSIVIMSDDVDKLFKISDRLILGLNGNPGDTMQFAQFMQQNLHLYSMKNAYDLGTSAVVHFVRKNLADSLKSGAPNILNLLVAAYENGEGGQLYSLDFLAACVKVPFAAHGYGGMFAVSIMDNYYKPNLSEADAYEILRKCVMEIHQRLFLSLTNFKVKMVSAQGVRELPSIKQSSFISIK